MSWWLELFLTSEMCRAQILVLWDSIIVIVAAICWSALPGMALGCQSSQQPYRIEELLSLFFWWGNWGSRRKGMQKVVIVMWEGSSSLHCLPKWEGKRRCRRGGWENQPVCPWITILGLGALGWPQPPQAFDKFLNPCEPQLLMNDGNFSIL